MVLCENNLYSCIRQRNARIVSFWRSWHNTVIVLKTYKLLIVHNTHTRCRHMIQVYSPTRPRITHVSIYHRFFFFFLRYRISNLSLRRNCLVHVLFFAELQRHEYGIIHNIAVVQRTFRIRHVPWRCFFWPFFSRDWSLNGYLYVIGSIFFSVQSSLVKIKTN